MISYLLQQFNSRSSDSGWQSAVSEQGLSKDVLDMIKEEARRSVAEKLAVMVDALTESSGLDTGGIQSWVEVLHEDGAKEDEHETIAQLFVMARAVFNNTVIQSRLLVKPLVKGSSKNLKLPPTSQLAQVEVRREDLDLMAQSLLHNVEPLKVRIADHISQMVTKARRTGLSTPSHASVRSGDEGTKQAYH